MQKLRNTGKNSTTCIVKIGMITFGGFQITIFKDIYNETSLKTMGINERQIKAILYVKEKGSITTSEYQQLNNIGRTTATEDLSELVSKSLLSHSGTGKGSTYTLK